MSELSKVIDCMKDKTEDTFDFYSKKEHWDASDLKCAKEAAQLYDMLQTIQMNTGIWENMKRTGDYSFARYPRISYDHDAFGRGRDADTGRYVSRGERYYDERHHGYDHGYDHDSYGRPHYADGRSMHSVKDQAIQRLEALMDMAESEYEREEIREMIKKIEAKER